MRKLVHLVNHYNLEVLLLVSVQLLAARHLFDQLLNDDSIIIIGFTRSYLQVIHRGKNNASTGRTGISVDFVFFLLTLDLVDIGRVVKCVENALG